MFLGFRRQHINLWPLDTRLGDPPPPDGHRTKIFMFMSLFLPWISISLENLNPGGASWFVFQSLGPWAGVSMNLGRHIWTAGFTPGCASELRPTGPWAPWRTPCLAHNRLWSLLDSRNKNASWSMEKGCSRLHQGPGSQGAVTRGQRTSCVYSQHLNCEMTTSCSSQCCQC